MDNQTTYGVEEEVAEKQLKIGEFFKKNLYEIAVVLVCVVRVVVGIAQIGLSGKSVIEIIGDSLLTIVFAVLMARLLEEKGLVVGEQGKNYTRAIEEYRIMEQRAGAHIKEMDSWCETYSKEEYAKTLTTMLYQLGITYNQYVAGDYDESKFSKNQLHQLHKIKRTMMYVYTTEELMSGDIDYVGNGKCLKASKKKYRRRSAVSDLGTKIALALIFGLLTLPPLTQWDWSGMIWKLFETVVLFGFSVVKYFSAYTFVDEDLVAKVVCKTTILKRFLADVEGENKTLTIVNGFHPTQRECQVREKEM